MCANQCEHSINLLKGHARSWLFSITSILLYAHNFWQILISRSYFWTTAQPFPMGNIYLARPSFLVLQRTPCICTFRAPDSSPGRAWSHPMGWTLRLLHPHPHCFLLSLKPDKKQISKWGTKLDLWAWKKKWIIGLEVSNIKISTSLSLAFSKYFIQLDIKSKIKSCTIW